ncbi:MAG: hypothetical protein EXR62_11805 [Chloroflexi bacterium]|nr:hypothetical protein [Chloroflexota bacterium]
MKLIGYNGRAIACNICNQLEHWRPEVGEDGLIVAFVCIHHEHSSSAKPYLDVVRPEEVYQAVDQNNPENNIYLDKSGMLSAQENSESTPAAPATTETIDTEEPALSTDDVLDMAEFLRDFDGDFQGLFEE